LRKCFWSGAMGGIIFRVRSVCKGGGI